MIDFDNAGQSREPELLPALASAEPPADHARSKPFPSKLVYACLAALIWTIVLLCFIAVKASVASTIAATLVSVVAVVTSLIGVFQPPKPRSMP